MYRSLIPIVAASVVLGCDPVVNRTLSLTPSSAGMSSGVQAATSEALSAVERVARGFGLNPIASVDPRNCQHRWESDSYRHGNRNLRLSVCATPTQSGELEVRIAEFITSCWTPKGDSLRVAVADTLARFGPTRDLNGDRQPPNVRCS